MKKFLVVVLIVFGFMVTLGAGTAAGASIAYLLLKARPAQASGFSSDEIAAATQDRENGILVSGVTAGSPAAEAGIVRGDIILTINGDEINSMTDFEASLEPLEAGAAAAFSVLHGDDIRAISVTIPEESEYSYLGIMPCADRMQFHPFLGMPGEGEFELPFQRTTGAMITNVVEASPAAEAGLQAGDLIESVDGEEVTPENDLASLIGNHDPGDSVTLSVQREGEENPLVIEVTLGENPDDSERAYLGVSYQPAAGVLRFGEGQLPLDQLPFELPDLENLPFGEGSPNVDPFNLPEGTENAVLIAEVLADTPAEQAGLQAGDLITAVDADALTEADQLVEKIQNSQPGDEITLTVIRLGAGDPEDIVILLGEHPDNPDQGYLGVKIQSISTIQEFMPPDLENFQLPEWPFGDPEQFPPQFEEQGESA